LNAASILAVNDREVMDISYVYGAKLSPDGSLLFQPATQGMDIFDSRVGTLRSRVAFPVPLSTNYDALVSDGKDGILLAITGTTGDGIAIVDLSSIPEPPPLPYVNEAAPSATSLHSSSHSTREGAGRSSKNSRALEKWPRLIPHVTNPNLSRP
jgi:hypothetical protein